MVWPTPQDYNEAIQNPAVNLADPELAGGETELTPLGLPRPITGNFASVYRVHCGVRDFAVRCFWREYADMQRRYDAISRHLQLARLPHPYTVAFEYLRQGIRIRGQWYPLLKMEWVEGDLLVSYIERHLHHPAVLTRFADRWLQMARALESAHIAHGDLQHGNVLVVRDQPVLVDYDGMFVPALGGLPSHELGHQHYQHPRRSAAHFDRWIDQVSVLVIYASIRALACRPELWERLHGGDEALLLRKSDLADPAASPTFQLLATCPDSALQEALGALRRALAAQPGPIPFLATRQPTGRRAALRPRGLRRPVFAALPAAAAPVAPAAPPWLAGHLADQRVAFRPLDRQLRLTVIGAVVTMPLGPSLHAVLSVLPMLTAFVPVLQLLAALLLLVARYRADPGVITRRAIGRKERVAARQLSMTTKTVRRLEKRKALRLARLDRRLDRQQQGRRRLEDEQAGERACAKAQREQTVQRLDELLRRLAEHERATVESLLVSLQACHVREYLSGCRLRPEEPPGVRRLRVLYLWLTGIRSAADLSSESIDRLRRRGEPTLHALVSWRVECELRARRSLPRVLPPETLGRLAEEYGAKRAALEGGRRRAHERERALLGAMQMRYQAKYRPIDAEVQRLRAEREEACRSLDARLRVADEERAVATAQLSRIQRELEPYAGLTFLRYVRSALIPVSRASLASPNGSPIDNS